MESELDKALPVILENITGSLLQRVVLGKDCGHKQEMIQRHCRVIKVSSTMLKLYPSGKAFSPQTVKKYTTNMLFIGECMKTSAKSESNLRIIPKD